MGTSIDTQNDHLVISNDAQHPANLICELCRNFYTLGWVSSELRSHGNGPSISSTPAN